MEIPSNKDLLSVVNSPDLLTLVIRGHQLIERVLEAAVSEALPTPHAVELSRISFSLKVDLAIALGAISLKSRASYVVINRIRNRFAHDSAATFEFKDAQDLYNAVSPHQRFLMSKTYAELPSAQALLGNVLAVVFLELKGAVTKLRDAKLEAEVLHEIAQEEIALAAHITKDVYGDEIQREVKERVEKKKKRSNTKT